MPSPTASRTFAACSRSAATARAAASAASSRRCSFCRRALRTAAAICCTSPSTSSSCSCEYSALLLITWTTPTTRALVLDRNHHRRAAPGRPRLRQLPHLPLAVDVVVRAARLLHDLGDVVEEQRLAADDHAALHAAALAVQRHRWKDRRVETVAVRPRVVAADEAVALVVRRDEDAVVRDDVRRADRGNGRRRDRARASRRATAPRRGGAGRPWPSARARARSRRDGTSARRAAVSITASCSPSRARRRRSSEIHASPAAIAIESGAFPDRRASCAPRSSPDRRSRPCRRRCSGTQSSPSIHAEPSGFAPTGTVATIAPVAGSTRVMFPVSLEIQSASGDGVIQSAFAMAIRFVTLFVLTLMRTACRRRGPRPRASRTRRRRRSASCRP